MECATQATEKLVAIQFFLLAPFIIVEALRHLLGGEHAETSILGMALTASSVIGMPSPLAALRVVPTIS